MKLATVMLAACMGAAGPASAATILATQDFEDNTTTDGFLTGAELGTDPGTFFDGTGLGWTVSGDPQEGTNADADLIGVVSATSPVSLGSRSLSLPAGNQWFNFDDTDDGVTLAFDDVVTTGFADLVLGFSWANSATTFEAADVFRVSVNQTPVFEATETQLNTGPQRNALTPVTLDISQFDGQTLSVSVFAAANLNAEDFAFDGLTISGTAGSGPTNPNPTPIPVPAAGWLLISGLGLLVWRRRAAA
jgi:hypothetical protein